MKGEFRVFDFSFHVVILVCERYFQAVQRGWHSAMGLAVLLCGKVMICCFSLSRTLKPFNLVAKSS